MLSGHYSYTQIYYAVQVYDDDVGEYVDEGTLSNISHDWTEAQALKWFATFMVDNPCTSRLVRITEIMVRKTLAEG